MQCLQSDRATTTGRLHNPMYSYTIIFFKCLFISLPTFPISFFCKKSFIYISNKLLVLVLLKNKLYILKWLFHHKLFTVKLLQHYINFLEIFSCIIPSYVCLFFYGYIFIISIAFFLGSKKVVIVGNSFLLATNYWTISCDFCCFKQNGHI